MTRPDADADGSVDPPPPSPPAATGTGLPTDVPADVLTDLLVVAVATATTVAARARADAGRLDGGWAGGVVTGEAEAVAGVAERLRAELVHRGTDPGAASAPLRTALTAHDAARPSRDAAEALVGARLARGLVADLAAAVAAVAAVDAGGDAADGLAGLDDPLADPAARTVADAAADRRTHDRLALLGRRMLGEALVLVDALLAVLPALAGAVDAAEGGRRALRQRVKSAHGRRVGGLGL